MAKEPITCFRPPTAINPCPLCEAGEYGRQAVRRYLFGDLSSLEIRMEFGISDAQLQEHINYHEIVKDENTGDMASPDFFLNEMFTVLNQLKGYVKLLYHPDRKQDISDIKVVTNLLKEVRFTIESAEKIYGRTDRRPNNTTIQIEQMNMKWLSLTKIINKELCPSCRMILLDHMDTIPEITSSTSKK